MAASVLCLSLSLLAVAIVEAATHDLRQSDAALDGLRAEYALDFAHSLAVEQLLERNPYGRADFTIESEGGPFEVIAEPEAPKLSVQNAQRIPARVFKSLGVNDSGSLQARLEAFDPAKVNLGALDAAKAWQDCGASLISVYGKADKFFPLPRTSLESGRFSWRAGEVWRIRVAGPSGRIDERWVRFTGDPHRPAAVIARDYRPADPLGDACDQILG